MTGSRKYVQKNVFPRTRRLVGVHCPECNDTLFLDIDFDTTLYNKLNSIVLVKFQISHTESKISSSPDTARETCIGAFSFLICFMYLLVICIYINLRMHYF